MADQHKNGEENRLKRHGHRQKLKWIRIKEHPFRPSGICSNPDHKGDQIEQQKGERSTERGDEIGDPLPG